MNSSLSEKINALLPQTQCQLCQYKGCKPYAEAITTQNESIDKCLPGGTPTLNAIANLLDIDPTPYEPLLKEQTKPITLAVIREEECIGCTKCIQACPVDAILGAAKKMHTVITDACNGCELCIPPCPVDCIDTINHPSYSSASEISTQSRERYERKQQRLNTPKNEESVSVAPIDDRKNLIADILKRKKQRKPS